VFTLLVLAGARTKWFIKRWAGRRDRNNLGDVLGSFSQWLMVLVALLVAATIVLPSVQPVDLLAGLGVGSIAIGFAFKDILKTGLPGCSSFCDSPSGSATIG
jgi:small-conductance mechanosensitive channel